MELNKFILLLTSLFIFSLIQVSQCTLKEISVIKYFPRESHQDTNVSLKPATQYILTSGGYTYCLRVNFWTWFQNSLFRTASNLSLELKNYIIGTGVVIDGEFSHPFKWKNLLQLSYYSWNSFCVSSHLSNLYFSINGKDVFNLTKGKQPEKIDVSTIILGGNDFTGQISDLNIWNRSLSQEEILEYSASCDFDFVQKSNPGILLWSLANITIQGTDAEKATIPRKHLCHQVNDSKSNTNIVLFPRSLKYVIYYQQCKNLNGEMFYPQSVKDIQILLENIGSSLVNNACTGKFWVPFVRSETHDSGWIYVSKKHQDEDHSFSTWMKANLIDSNTKNQCMYFDITDKQFKSTECSTTEYFCSFCEIKESRHVFNLHSDCTDSETEMDTVYFFVPQNPGYYFSGVLGYTNIETTENCEWKVTNVRDSMNASAEMAGHDGLGCYPFGIQTWSHEFEGCSKNSSVQMKLSNVSSCLLNRYHDPGIAKKLKK